MRKRGSKTKGREQGAEKRALAQRRIVEGRKGELSFSSAGAGEGWKGVRLHSRDAGGRHPIGMRARFIGGGLIRFSNDAARTEPRPPDGGLRNTATAMGRLCPCQGESESITITRH